MDRKKYKKEKLDQIQGEIWEHEINILVQESYQEEALQKLDRIKEEIGSADSKIKNLEESHKYEDRQVKKAAEDELKKWQNLFDQQKAEIDKSNNLIAKHRDRINNCLFSMNIIEKKF